MLVSREHRDVFSDFPEWLDALTDWDTGVGNGDRVGIVATKAQGGSAESESSA